MVPKMKSRAPKTPLTGSQVALGQEAQAELADREARAVEDLVGDRADQDDRGDAGDERDARRARGRRSGRGSAAGRTRRRGAAGPMPSPRGRDYCGRPAFRPRSPPRHHTETIRQPSPHRHRSVTPFRPTASEGWPILRPEHLGHSDEERSLEKKDSHLERGCRTGGRARCGRLGCGPHERDLDGQGRQSHRGGQLVRLPARLAVDPGRQLGPRHPRHLRLRRQRRRHPADHQPHGGLRRQRRAAQPRAVRRLQRLRPDPLGAVGNGDRLQPLGRLDPPQARRAP